MTKTEKRIREELRQRVCDIAQGAVGGAELDLRQSRNCEDDTDSLCFQMGIQEWIRFVMACKTAFDGQIESFAFQIWNLHRFEFVEDLVNHLYHLRIEESSIR